MFNFLKKLFSKNTTLDFETLGSLRGNQLSQNLTGTRTFDGSVTFTSGIIVSGITVIDAAAKFNATSLPIASAGTLGAIKVGTGLSIVSGILSTAGSSSVVKFTASIGDGSSTDITVTHNLGTRDLTVTVLDLDTFDYVLPDIVYTSTNSITVSFGVAPTVNQYRIIIVG